ncbi:MAG: RHS repeat-associated core domain-containing protein [Acidobacteriota bacterium]|nr:RHS repeat-associated core domain-containing protein [Acidobacteriota bacterium]
MQARTEFSYDNPATTANVTVTRNWDSTKGAVTTPLTSGNSISTTNQYATYSNGATGKLIKTFDANNVATAFTYGDIGNGVTDLYVTKTIVAETTSVARTSENKYDFHTGVPIEAKDTDNNVVTQTTLDVFGRPTLVKEAVGTAVERRTATEYSDTMRRVITRSDLNTAGDGKLVSIQHYDQLDRLRLSRTLEDSTTQDPYNEQHGIKVQTRYAYSGSNSYEIVSAAYRAATSGAAGGETEMAWRRIKNDQGGKIIELETFAGATPPAPWGGNTTSTGKVTTAYDAEFTTVTDQMNRSRRSMVDGFGRLVRVDEPDATNGGLGTTASPVQPTNYTYSALDKLTQTVQGAQTRTFNYSSLSRLISATNPENGTVSYAYDNNGNLLTKTDARNITATHSYDPLNRNTTISYSGGASPTIQRFYDGAVKGKGRLWYSLSYNVHPTSGQLAYSYTIVDSYDELGRAKTGSQNFLTNNGTTWMSYPISRTFDIAGNVKTQSYPSTRSTTYNYDNAGRINSFSGNIGDGVSRTYANEFLFNAQGQIKRERFGTTTALYHNIHYNSRGQAVDIRLGTSSADEWTWNRGALITYFSNQARSAGNAFLNANDNNGNVTMQEHYVPMDDAYSSYAIPLRDTYEYDFLNRVTQANGVQRTTGGAWPSVYAQHYSYDRWGNRWINSAGTWGANIFNTAILPNSANNRLNGMTYDSAGNTTTDNITGGGARTYDADNRMTSAQSGATWNYYVYDADGKRVRRIVNGIETWQVYGFSGELLAEYSVNGAAGSPLKEYANGGQTMIVGDATNVRWTVADALGTPRILADKTGSLSGITRHDYLPFGEELFVGMGNGSIRTTGMGYANSGTNDGIRKKFTGYERDDETGLDYAQARYYSSKQGRFTSPDEFTGGPDELYDFADVASENPMIYAELDEPQSLNKYQYCFNNPLALVDPDGHKSWKDWARTVVEVATYVPGPIGTVASVVQAVDKLAQGDYAGAASSALGAAPGAKLLRAGVRAVDKLTDGARVLDKLNDTRKQGTAIKAAGNACGLCFTAGTEVSTPDGLKKIEDIRVGDRVTTTGINKDRPDGWTAVDPKQWRVVKLLMPDPKGSEDVYEIELLRSLEWIRKVGAAPRRFIEIELREMGLSGLAKVETITACPPIKAGLGRVVLMTVTHMDSGVMEIEFDGLKKALEPTVSHPLFSADRNDWTPAGLLHVGERIKTRTGNAQIKAIHWKKGEHRVYNFEVEADHAYLVSNLELLSHNSGACNLEARAKQIQGKLGGFTQKKTTTAVVETTNTSGQTVTLVASSERALRPSQRAALKKGEVAVKGDGHAEVTALNAARQMGLKPRRVAASRPICPQCAEAIQEAGAEAVSKLK